MQYRTRVVGRRLVRTVEIGGWRISVRRSTLDWLRWCLIRDGTHAFALYLPFAVMTVFGGR